MVAESVGKMVTLMVVSVVDEMAEPLEFSKAYMKVFLLAAYLVGNWALTSAV